MNRNEEQQMLGSLRERQEPKAAVIMFWEQNTSDVNEIYAPGGGALSVGQMGIMCPA